MRKFPDSFMTRTDKTEVIVRVGDDDIVFREKDISKFVQVAITPASSSRELALVMLASGYASMLKFPRDLKVRLKSMLEAMK